MSARALGGRTISSNAPSGTNAGRASTVLQTLTATAANPAAAASAIFEDYFQGVTGGTLSVAGGISTVLKSAGLTISRYSMSGE
jgi:hypothetical protein